jgi:hypothetical protein
MSIAADPRCCNCQTIVARLDENGWCEQCWLGLRPAYQGGPRPHARICGPRAADVLQLVGGRRRGMERTARPSDARYFDRGLDHRAAVLPGPEIKVAVSQDGCAMGARYAGSAPLDRPL